MNFPNKDGLPIWNTFLFMGLSFLHSINSLYFYKRGYQNVENWNLKCTGHNSWVEAANEQGFLQVRVLPLFFLTK